MKKQLGVVWPVSLQHFRMSNQRIKKLLPGFPRGFYLTMGARDCFGVSDIDETMIGSIIVPDLQYKMKGCNKGVSLVDDAIRTMYADQYSNDGVCTVDELIKKTVILYARAFLDESYLASQWYDGNVGAIASYIATEGDWRSPRLVVNDGSLLQAQMVIDSLTQWYEQYKEETK